MTGLIIEVINNNGGSIVVDTPTGTQEILVEKVPVPAPITVVTVGEKGDPGVTPVVDMVGDQISINGEVTGPHLALDLETVDIPSLTLLFENNLI